MEKRQCTQILELPRAHYQLPAYGYWFALRSHSQETGCAVAARIPGSPVAENGFLMHDSLIAACLPTLF